MTQNLVLVVEDEPAIAETIVYALETDGYLVDHCGTGGEALEKITQISPAFVVLDVGLPDFSGFDVCRAIRKTSEVPILFLTARESEIDRVVGLEIGADDYVVKPFSPRELTARIHAILRRSTKRQASAFDENHPFEFGRFRLLSESFRAELDEVDLGLSRYEFGMLEVFMRHPERVFSRDQLMELVWDEPEAALDRTVDAHIKTLRRKIHEVDAGFDPIQTRRGLGYSFVPETECS
ncbi:MAG: two-component system response regulator CreB [Verrucomicrobiota bacterium]